MRWKGRALKRLGPGFDSYARGAQKGDGRYILLNVNLRALDLLDSVIWALGFKTLDAVYRDLVACYH